MHFLYNQDVNTKFNNVKAAVSFTPWVCGGKVNIEYNQLSKNNDWLEPAAKLNYNGSWGRELISEKSSLCFGIPNHAKLTLHIYKKEFNFVR